MISAVTLRRVGQLNAENLTLRNRMEALRAERDWLLKRLADCHSLKAEDTDQDVQPYFVRRD